jgi:hypothetical protein
MVRTLIAGLLVALMMGEAGRPLPKGQLRGSELPAPLRSNQRLWVFQFTYSFPLRETVYIEGLGEVPASGRLSFFGRSTPKVLDPATRKSLDYDQSWTRVFPGYPDGKLYSLPEESDFPAAGRDIEWPPRANAQLISMRVLNRWRTGYFPYERDGKYYLRTVLVPFPSPIKRRVTALSLMVSHPHTTSKTRLLRIQSLVRMWRHREPEDLLPVGQSIQEAANAQVDRFVADLLAEGKK